VCIFRVVQEALQNAVRHGRAKTISVHLKGRPSGLALTIVDDGVGFDVKRVWGKGLGLVSMTERLESIGGSLAVHSRPGAGSSIEVTAPIAPAQVTETV
jgi:signal transduction histidine kinase